MTVSGVRRPSRREFLLRSGFGLGLLPLLQSERASGQTATAPRRFVSITWANGVIPEDFYPPQGQLTEKLPPVLSPLEPWKAKVLALRGAGAGSLTGGVDLTTMVDEARKFDGHASYPTLLTGSGLRGSPASPSIDTLIGDRLSAQGFPAPRLNLVCRGNLPTTWGTNGLRNPVLRDPGQVYARLFGGGASPLPPDLLLARRKSVIDFSLDDITRFQARLGKEDRVTVDTHLAALRTIELQLAATPTTMPGCKAPVSPAEGTNYNLAANYPLHVKLMIDMIAAAIRCDLARTFTLDLIDGEGVSLTFPWLGLPSTSYSTIAHSGAPLRTQKTAIDTWFYSQVGDLVGQMAAHVEGGSTSLDNSVVLVSNGMNVGGNDSVEGIPYLIVGSGGGFFKQGTCVQFPTNVPNNQLLTSVCHAMDLNVPSVGTTYAGDLDTALRA